MKPPRDLVPARFNPWTQATDGDLYRLIAASYAGDLPTVDALLTAHPLLHRGDLHYYTPLYFALRENHLPVAHRLLAAGADPFLVGLHFDTLTAFLHSHQRSAALSLISFPHLHSPAGDPLAALIRDRNLPAVHQSLARDPSLLHTPDSRGNFPLHWAVMTHQLPLIDHLLSLGAPIDQRRADGARPLELTNGDYFYRGWRDLPAAALRPHHVLIGYLLARGADYDISTAARLGDLDRVRHLLSADPSLLNHLPPYSGYYNSSPLRNAARAGHLPVVEYLLAQGADPNLPESIAPHGAVLRDAISGEHWDIVKLLLHHGANPNAMVDSSGNCVWAAKNAPADVQALLAEKGGILGLEMACYDGNVAYIEAQLQADPTAPLHLHLPLDNQPLVELALRYQPDILTRCSLPGDATAGLAHWLIDRGIDCHTPDWLGATPLHRAVQRNNESLVQILLPHHPDLDARDDLFHETPHQWALRLGHAPLAALLS